MKRTFFLTVLLVICIFSLTNKYVNAGLYVTGDINGDDRIGLEEAVFALQTVSGINSQGENEEEANDIRSEAQQINTVSATLGKIGYTGDTEDWFKIVVPENGLFQFAIENLNEPNSENSNIGVCYLYQESGANLVELTYVTNGNGYYGYTAPNTMNASSNIPVSGNGIYFIKIAQYGNHIARYELKTSYSKLQTKDYGEPDNSYNNAHLIQENETITSLIGYENDESDWYKIQMPSNGQFQFSIENLHSEPIGNAHIGVCYLYHKDGVDLVELTYVTNGNGYYGYTAPDTMNASSNIPVSANEIYFIKIAQYYNFAAPYQLKTSFTELQIEDSGEPDNSYNEAQLIQENETKISLIGYGNDEEDWYKIQISANGQLQFSIANFHMKNIDNGFIGVCYLYHKNGADLVELTYVTSGNGYYGYTAPDTMNASSNISVSANEIYFIKIAQYYNFAAPYQLETVFMPDK